MAAVHAGRERPRDFQILYVAGIDLVERAETGGSVIFGGAYPLIIVGFQLALVGLGRVAGFRCCLLRAGSVAAGF